MPTTLNAYGKAVPFPPGVYSKTKSIQPFLLTVLLLLSWVLISTHAHGEESSTTQTDPEFNPQWFDDAQIISRTLIRSGKFVSPDLVQKLYEENNYQPLWTNTLKNDSWIRHVDRSLRELEYDALPLWRYHLAEIHQLSRQVDKSWLLDIYLTDALSTAINDLSGQLVPDSVLGRQWKLKNKPLDVGAQVSALRFGINPSYMFALLRPDHPQYELLRKAYRKALHQNKVIHLEDGENLQLGDSGFRVSRLIERLQAEGLLDPREHESNHSVYTLSVAEAVKQFQGVRGLKVDGIVGRQTRYELNRGPEDIAHKIALNLQRWRSAPREFPSTHILVNTAAYRMELIEKSKKTLEMDVIVGKRSRPTPSFSDSMTLLVLNPNWNIPSRITHEEILPKLRKDRSYAYEQGIRALQGKTVIDWDEINDEALFSDHFPYRLQQMSGRHNVLGQYKFLFPNKYLVYLHDTPFKELFDNNRRAFSHGCVRLEKPEKLANYLLARKGWTENKVRRTLRKGKRRMLALKEPLPVFLMYLTSWVNDQGILELYPDTYRQDGRIKKELIALNQSPFASEEAYASAETVPKTLFD